MIYEDLRSTFSSLEGTFLELRGALRTVASDAAASGRINEAITLLGLATAADNQATAAQQNAAAVLGFPNLANALAEGRQRVTAQQGLVQASIRRPFDLTVGGLGSSGDVARCEQLLTSVEDTLERSRQAFEEADVPQGPAYNIGRLRSTIDDIASYPVLTTETPTSGSGAWSGAGGGATTGTSNARTVESAVRSVLGRLPKYTDAKAFTAALAATFELRQEEGHTLTTWRPRGFVGQTELGGSVSGAQASLYARAKDALAVSLPVLAGLTPLRTDADVQEMDAARSVVEAEFRAIVDELGTPGGPRSARVDRLFATLLTDDVFGVDNVRITGGMVGYLAFVFGLESGQVNTIEEEQVYSNFLLVRDYIGSIQTTWLAFNQPSGRRDLGTLLVLLSNALQVVAESVDEASAALESVFVGSAEQTVARFNVGGGRTMLVSELLSWISSFSAAEAPELVQQGGRRAMGAIETTATTLIELVGALITATRSDPGLPVGMRHPRVRHPLEELETYLGQVVQLAADIRTV
jgi:hypothetical protein